MTRNQTYILVGGCLLALCAAGVFAGGAYYLFINSDPVLAEPISESVTIPPNPRPDASGNSMGDPNAPVHMEEFSDFQCPYCQRFHDQTEPSLVEEYIKTGRLYFTYHSMGNWVSENIGGGKTESQDAAMAAYCAMDQGKFWEYQDMLFANLLGEDVGSFTDQSLSNIAGQTGLDVNEFDGCFGSGKYEALTQQDMDKGLSVGVNGTPSFLVTYTINGVTETKLIEGAQPFEVFQQELDAILKQIGE